MKMRDAWTRNSIGVLFLVVMALVISCGGKEVTSSSQPADKQTAAPAQDQPLGKPYRQIVVAEYETTPEIARDYPTALRECQSNTVWALQEKKSYQTVESGKAVAARGPAVLLVKAKVTELRIVSGHARIWGGAFAGASFMNIDVTLVDAATNATVREKKLTTSNNAWAASWVGGASDVSIPADMGKVIAEYVHSVVPK